MEFPKSDKATEKAVADIRYAINTLAVASCEGPAARETVNGTRYTSFINGHVHPEGDPVATFIGSLDELVAQTIAGVVAERENFKGPVNIIWRDGPMIEKVSDGGIQSYVRLAFEPAPVAVVAHIDAAHVGAIHELERLLAMAVSGELRAFAYVAVAKGRIVGSGWKGDEDGHLHTLTSGAARLAQRLTAEEGH